MRAPLALLAGLLLSGLAVAEEGPAPSATQRALYEALSIRDPAPACTELADLTEDPVGDLSWLVDHAEQPAWVGMRAAGCLLADHLDAAEPIVHGWLTGAHTRGLAILVVNHLEQLPEPRAEDLARIALSGPHAASLRPRLARSGHPALRSLGAQDLPVEPASAE